jgi:GNAT superfamily N-acetyltransferase
LNTPSIFLPKDDGQIESCFDAFSALRPHLTRELFVPQVRRQESQGYQIVAVMEHGQVSSAAGFRLCEFLAWGRILYIDDLSTLPSSRGKGYAGMLLDWLAAHAQQQGCNAVHLDTGYARHAAHRVYLSKGFELSSHHMAKALVSQ